MKVVSGLAAVIVMLASVTAASEIREHSIPRIARQNGRFALMVDDVPYLVLGAQVNNSSAWPAVLPKVWPAIEFMHANTVEMPVYWEQFEPTPGQYDYSVVDTLLSEARAHHVHLILLWFATWKNGNAHYMPQWMKVAPDIYPRVLDADGRPVDSPSPFAAASMDADAKAFAALMRRLKATDPQRTVLMIQVENEPGVYGVTRDYSAAAEKLFRGPVPADVLDAMHPMKGVTVSPTIGAMTWREAYGAEAEVNFHAWAVATYIEHVAAAGKAIYPLPMFSNVALRDPMPPAAPGTYESGGATDNVIPIWKVAAPSLDILGPDDYQTDTAAYIRVLDLYHREDNPLYLPETGGSPRFLFFALGRQAIGFSPFGMDFTKTLDIPDAARPRDELLVPWARTGTKEFVAPFVPLYRLLNPMAHDLARWSFEGKLQATAEEPGQVRQTLHFGAWDAIVSFGIWARRGRPVGNPQPMGGVLIAQISDCQFLVSGFYTRVDFQPTAAERHRQFLKVEEGAYENGEFRFIRLLNGDQNDGGLDFSSVPLVLRVSVASF
jgi:hypothetical protein